MTTVTSGGPDTSSILRIRIPNTWTPKRCENFVYWQEIRAHRAYARKCMEATTAFPSAPQRAREAASIGSYELAAITAVTVVALALRIFHMGYHSLNGGDEP